MNYDLVLLVVFYLFLFIIFKLYKNKFEVQWKIFVLYKTKIGIKLMDKITRKDNNKKVIIFGYILLLISVLLIVYGLFNSNKYLLGIGLMTLISSLLVIIPLKFTGIFGVIIGFLGMAVTTIFLVKSAYSLVFIPEALPGLAPVLPGVSVPGLPRLSFLHWILAILLVATIHEFSHGIYSRLIKVKIKSTGFAFLGPILAAFVEPDEGQLAKKKTNEQLQVLSAGSFSNVLLALFTILFLVFIFSPISSKMVDLKGVEIADIDRTLPINMTNINPGDIIESINGVIIDDVGKIKSLVKDLKSEDEVRVKTDKGEYTVKLGANKEKETILGVSLTGYKTEVKPNYKIIYPLYSWIAMLLFWIFNISFGVGLFNLLPLGPVDGGKMFYVSSLHFTKDSKKAAKMLSIVSIIILLLIFVNMWPFILKLLSFIFSPLLLFLQ